MWVKQSNISERILHGWNNASFPCCLNLIGVHIYNHLTWHQHVDFVRCKLLKKSDSIFSVTWDFTLPKDFFHSINNTNNLPYLSCCSSAWTNNYPSRLRKLHVLQKQGRTLHHKRAPPLSPSITLFVKLNKLSIYDMNSHEIAKFMF